MFKSFINAIKIKDVRSRLLFTFMILIVIRLGSVLPIPGIDSKLVSDAIKSMFESSGGALDFLSAITGGSFEKVSIFALSVTPYITSSIIMQLLTIAIPKLEELHKDGEEGRRKIAEYTRYVTVILAIGESIAMAVSFNNLGYIEGDNKFLKMLAIVATLTAGSAVLMWLGERITEKGVGNGISIILLINIVSRVPSDMSILFQQFVGTQQNVARGILAAVVIVGIVFLMVWFACLLQGAERRIPVQYSQKVQGRKSYGGQSSNIPLKVNTAGVIPVIFASSLLSFPIVIINFIKGGELPEWAKYFSQSYWCDLNNIKYTVGLLVYMLLIVLFAYFYTSVTFNPMEISNNMKKNGGFIPGIRPGKPTTDYLNMILNSIVFIGAVGLIIVAVVPIILSGTLNAEVSFFGTSVIIIVGVILETMKKIESQMVVRNYKGFLND